jgi:hypothetical protein
MVILILLFLFLINKKNNKAFQALSGDFLDLPLACPDVLNWWPPGLWSPPCGEQSVLG